MDKDPAFAEGFFGREKILSVLTKRVDAFRDGYHKNVGLVGKEFIGKSSLLQKFINSLHYPDIIPVYLEVQHESFGYFVRRFMGMLLVGYFQSIGKMVPHDIDPMIRAGKKELPQTTKKMQKILGLVKRGRSNEAFNELLSLTMSLHEETGKKVLLVLDEFTRFETFNLKDPFTALGKHIMVQKNTMYLAASSESKNAYNIFNEKLSLLFGNFEVLKINSFDFSTSLRFLDNHFRNLPISKNLQYFIIRLTNGHPYYLSVLTKAITHAAEERKTGEVSEAVCIQALEKQLFYSGGEIASHFSTVLTMKCQSKRALLLDSMVAIALGHKKARSIAKFTGRKLEDVKKVLMKLLAEDMLRKDGHFYYLDDTLLCFWLEYVYHLRRASLRINKVHLNTEFRRKVFALIKKYAEEDEKDISKRVEELFLMFKNDTLEVNKKRHKFPLFNKVITRSSDTSKDYPIFAKSPNNRWVCQVAKHKVTEEDVWNFLGDLKGARSKINRKILVVPYGIDINAKLLAQESKIALWRLKDLNHLFELFNKPKLIVEDDVEADVFVEVS